MNPKQGHSYNPTMKDHRSLLREVVEVEEKIIEDNLKDMKKTRPLLFARSEKIDKRKGIVLGTALSFFILNKYLGDSK